MPIYEYYCTSCRSTFEVRRSMSAVQTLEKCPQGHEGAKKVLSAFAMVGSAEEQCVNPAVKAGVSACCGGGACHVN
jgi:putative FmdB family regulatory protein